MDCFWQDGDWNGWGTRKNVVDKEEKLFLMENRESLLDLIEKLYICGLNIKYPIMDGFKNLEINNFRGIEHLKIDDLCREVVSFLPTAITKTPNTGIWMRRIWGR